MRQQGLMKETTKQANLKSDMVATTDFVGQQFRFRFRNRSLKEDNPVTVFLRYHKGNSDIELGFFTLSASAYFSSDNSTTETGSKPIVKRIGTTAGAIAYEVHFERLE